MYEPYLIYILKFSGKISGKIENLMVTWKIQKNWYFKTEWDELIIFYLFIILYYIIYLFNVYCLVCLVYAGWGLAVGGCNSSNCI